MNDKSPESTKKLKIAQCMAGAEFGGAENFYTRLVIALGSEPSIEQQAFTRENSQRVPALRDAGITVNTFRFGSPLDIVGRFRYRAALKRYHPDIVVTYMGRPSIITPKGDYLLVCRLGHYYNLKYYRHADYWIGISKGICQHMIDGGIPRDRIYFIPNFADETVVDPIPRDSFDTDPTQPLLLAAGRLHVNKGFDTLFKALKDIPKTTLWLAGDGPERESLQALCEREGLSDRIRFLGWRNDVAALMRTADIFVCPSRHEGLGSIVMESWYNQCPIVATNSQGPGEVIEDGVTGLVTPIDQPAPLAAAINELINDPSRRKQLADNALAEYRENYSQATIVEKYRHLFEDIKKQSHGDQ